MTDNTIEAFREVNLSDGKCNVSLYVCAEEEKKIDEDPEYASELFRAALEGKLPAAGEDSDAAPQSDSESNDIPEDPLKINSDVEWDDTATWALLNSLKNSSHLFDPKADYRMQLYRKAREDLLKEGRTVSIENIKCKFSNLHSTYIRIKSKGKKTGEHCTDWEFYEACDSLMTVLEENEKATKTNEDGVKIKQERLLDSTTLLKDEGSALSPHSGSSATLSREGSPVPSSDQQVVEHGSPKKSSSKTFPNKNNRKRKLMEENYVSVEEDEINEMQISSGMKKRKKSPSNVNNLSTSAGSNADHVIVSEVGEGFNHAATLLLLDCIRQNKDLLKTKKTIQLFSSVRKMMATNGFSFTEAKLRRKWYSLLITYRRILERANETGDIVSSWPYYEVLDSIISDTKALAKRYDSNDIANISASPNNKSNGIHRRQSGSLIDMVAGSDAYDASTDDGDFQRAFLAEWEEREQRREERDIMKLNLLQKIAKSMEMMVRKQDSLINVLKKH